MTKLLKALGVIFAICTIVFAVFLVIGLYDVYDSIPIIGWIGALTFIINGVYLFAISFGISENIDKNDYIISLLERNRQSEEESGIFKKCPKCGELNNNYSSSCKKCKESLLNAETIQK